MLTISILALSLLAPDRDAIEQDRALNQQVQNYLAVKPYPELSRTVQAWSKYPDSNRRRLTLKLIDKLSDRTFVGLAKPQDLIIFYRLNTGDLQLQGHGGVVYQDLFLVGGRAAWALSEMYAVRGLPELNAGLSQEEWNKRAKHITARFAPDNLPALQLVQVYMNVQWWWQMDLILQSWSKLSEEQRNRIAKELIERLDDIHETWFRDYQELRAWYGRLLHLSTPPPRKGLDAQNYLQTATGRAAYALGRLYEINDLPKLLDNPSTKELFAHTKGFAERINKELSAK